MISRAAKIGIFLWNLMDVVSEYSELIRGFYDALPPHLREAAGCPDDVVQIGQYGSDVSTCHIEAIAAYWDQIDGVEAFKNVAKTVAEDMAIGEFHRFLSKLYPPGVSFQRTAATHALAQADPEMYIAMRLNELWTFLGI